MSNIELLPSIISYLKENMPPTNENTGEILNDLNLEGIGGLADVKLEDEDIFSLCQALKGNTNFKGELSLKENKLTDQSGLELSNLLYSFKGLTSLTISHTKMGDKSAIYICQALKELDYPLEALKMCCLYLEEKGMRRTCELILKSNTLKTVQLGFVNDSTLHILSDTIRKESSLLSLHFQEDKNSILSQEEKDYFILALKENLTLTDIKIISSLKDPKDLFIKEAEFLCGLNKARADIDIQRDERNTALDMENIMAEIEQNIECSQMNLPVRKYYSNTFGRLLNDALYQLERHRKKYPELTELFKVEGSVQFIASYLLDNLPDNEKEQNKAA